jgi:hypothetical protein
MRPTTPQQEPVHCLCGAPAAIIYRPEKVMHYLVACPNRVPRGPGHSHSSGCLLCQPAASKTLKSAIRDWNVNVKTGRTYQNLPPESKEDTRVFCSRCHLSEPCVCLPDIAELAWMSRGSRGADDEGEELKLERAARLARTGERIRKSAAGKASAGRVTGNARAA